MSGLRGGRRAGHRLGPEEWGAGFRGDLFLAVGRQRHAGLADRVYYAVARGGAAVAVGRRERDRVRERARARSLSWCRRCGRSTASFDFGTGQVRRDLVVPSDAPLTPGQPLLVPAVRARARGRSDAAAAAGRAGPAQGVVEFDLDSGEEAAATV